MKITIVPLLGKTPDDKIEDLRKQVIAAIEALQREDKRLESRIRVQEG